MRITDVNCMIGPWPERLHQYKSVGDLTTVMDRYRLTDCIAFHSTALWSPGRGNAMIRQMAGESSGRVKACYVLQPNLGGHTMPDSDELLKQLARERPSAVKLYPKSQRFTVNDFYCGELLEVLNQLALPVLFDADEAPDIVNLPGIARSYPGIRFVILRQGANESKYTIPLIRKLDNVFFDTSIMTDTGIIEEIVNRFGSEKLLFGSGLPLFVPSGALSMIIYARIKDADKENIFYKNWLRIGGGEHEDH